MSIMSGDCSTHWDGARKKPTRRALERGVVRRRADKPGTETARLLPMQGLGDRSPLDLARTKTGTGVLQFSP